MSPDLEKYRAEIRGLGFPDDQQDEIIHILWAIAESFADRAFGLDERTETGDIAALADCCDEGQGIDSMDSGMQARFAACAEDENS